jgi:hypothetical protein
MSRGSLDFESVNGGSIPPPGAKPEEPAEAATPGAD